MEKGKIKKWFKENKTEIQVSCWIIGTGLVCSTMGYFTGFRTGEMRGCNKGAWCTFGGVAADETKFIEYVKKGISEIDPKDMKYFKETVIPYMSGCMDEYLGK